MFVTLKLLAHQFLVNILAIFAILLNTLFIIISLPIYLYRWLLPKYLSPQFGLDIGKPLCGIAEIMAEEILNPEKHPPRCTIVSNVIIHGQVKLKDFRNKLAKNCLLAVTPSGQLKYPELTQFPQRKMGLLFWKEDDNFSLRNHLKLHVLDDTKDDLNSEIFLREMNEKLLNQPFTRNRSPWEIHLVQNYKNSNILQSLNGYSENCEKLTLLIIRIHHSLGDGFGFLNMVKNLFQKADEGHLDRGFRKIKNSWNFLSTLKAGVTLPIQIFSEWRRFIEFSLLPQTIFHRCDSKKICKQHYTNARVVSTCKVKYIKNTFKVRFGAVIESSYAAALRKISVKKVGFENIAGNMLLGSVLPKPNHPGTLTLHAYPMAYQIPYGADLQSVERLRICDERATKLMNSLQPKFLDFIFKIYTEHLPPVARLLSKNRFVPVCITNFRGPDNHLKWNGRRCLAYDFNAGGLVGAVGVSLSVFSYAGNVQINATADKGVMSGDEIREFVEYICDEIDLLYELALAENDAKKELQNVPLLIE